MTIFSTASRRPAIIAISITLYTLFLLWLYLPLLDIYFAIDDWVFLHYVKDLPPSAPWRYFSTTAVWFYRPLQVMQFAITYHLAGLNPLPYNIQLILMGLATVPLVWIFTSKLFGPAIATLAALLFSIPSSAPDVLFWKSNFNTHHYTIIVLLASITYTSYLHSRRPLHYWLTFILCLLSWFTKESCINLPIILLAIYITCHLQQRWQSSTPSPRPDLPALFRSTRHLIPLFIQALIYLILNRTLVKNAPGVPEVTYEIAPPLTAILQLGQLTSSTLVDFIYDPLILSRFPAIQGPLTVAVRYGFIFPILILILGLWKKIPAFIFAVLFIAISHFPTFILTNFNDTRYLYLGFLGYAIFVATLVNLPFQNTSPPRLVPRRPLNAVAAILAVAFFLVIYIGNVTYIKNWFEKVAIESAFFEKAARVIQAQGPSIPPNTALIIENASDRFLGKGTGSIQMVNLLTRRNDIIAVPTQVIQTDTATNVLNSSPHVFSIDVLTTSPALIKVK